MTLMEYQELAMRTAIDSDMTLYAPMGLAGEAGEVVDYIKKVQFHGHDLDKEKLIEELGDVVWYVAACCEAYGLTLEGVAHANIRKLEKRYPSGFTEEASRDRDG